MSIYDKVDDATASWINVLCQHRRSTLLLASALTCHELGEHQIAAAILELCAKLEPHQPQVQLLLGRSYLALGEHRKGTQALENACTLDPNSFEAQSSLLWCYSSSLGTSGNDLTGAERV
jgi:cytochrome c-type biogenesis protein CcmH/NrfG